MSAQVFDLKRGFLMLRVDPGYERGNRRCVNVDREAFTVTSVLASDWHDFEHAPRVTESVEDWLKR